MKYKAAVILHITVLIAAAGLALVFLGACGQDMNGKQNNRKAMQELLASKEDITIDCLGDSITWGMFATDELYDAVESGEIETSLDDGGQLFEDYGIYISGVFQSDPTYPELIESGLNRHLQEAGFSNTVTVVNDGICGDWITEDSYKRMSVSNPDVVILFLGGNDYYFDYPLEGTFETNIEALREAGAILYLANYPLYPNAKKGEYFKDANDYMAKIAKQENVELIDLEAMAREIVEGEGVPGIAEAGEYTWKDLFSPDHIHLSEKGYELVGNYITDTLWSEMSSK